MTNEVKWIVGSALFSGASVSGALYLLHRKMVGYFSTVKSHLESIEAQVNVHVNTLRAGVKAETVGVRNEVVRAESTVHTRIDSVLGWIEAHASELKSHAEDLRNHAKSVHDEAQASKHSVSRIVPTR